MYIHRLQHLCTCATLVSVTRKQPRALARPAIFVTIQRIEYMLYNTTNARARIQSLI